MLTPYLSKIRDYKLQKVEVLKSRIIKRKKGKRGGREGEGERLIANSECHKALLRNRENLAFTLNNDKKKLVLEGLQREKNQGK